MIFPGIGVGDSSASSLSATSNWIIRDGIGKIASISFAYYQGSQIDADCKRYRLLADFVNDLALTLNIISEVLPSPLRPYVYLVTSCCWAIVGVAGGCSRTVMTIHQARSDNASDVQAKDQSQETLVGLLGLVLSYFLIQLVSSSLLCSTATFAIFTTLHILCNWIAVRSLNMDVFNITRMRFLIAHYIETGEILSVEALNRKEPVIFNHYGACKIFVGKKYSADSKIIFENDSGLVTRKRNALFVHLFENYQSEDFFGLIAATIYEERNIQPTPLIIETLKEKVEQVYNIKRNHFAPSRHRVAKTE